eukprot:jgi/Mesvir1/21911/Mv01971-RA.4
MLLRASTLGTALSPLHTKNALDSANPRTQKHGKLPGGSTRRALTVLATRDRSFSCREETRRPAGFLSGCPWDRLRQATPIRPARHRHLPTLASASAASGPVSGGGPDRSSVGAHSVSGSVKDDVKKFKDGGKQPLPKSFVPVVVVAIVVLAGVTVAALPNGISDIAAFCSKSGLAAAFSLIFFSEIGDKTFFISALLAMRHSKLLVTVAATAALALMSVISTGLGYLFKEVPHSITSSAPIGEYAAVALLVYFGVRTLMQGLAMKPKAPKTQEEEDDEDSELQDAAVLVSEAEESLGGKSSAWAIMAEAFTLVFVAEWGDRSMLATIALGATQSPFGVAAGAIAGHFLATTLAVIGGSVLSRHISERVVTIVGGVMFLIFAVATLIGILFQ